MLYLLWDCVPLWLNSNECFGGPRWEEREHAMHARSVCYKQQPWCQSHWLFAKKDSDEPQRVPQCSFLSRTLNFPTIAINKLVIFFVSAWALQPTLTLPTLMLMGHWPSCQAISEAIHLLGQWHDWPKSLCPHVDGMPQLAGILAHGMLGMVKVMHHFMYNIKTFFAVDRSWKNNSLLTFLHIKCDSSVEMSKIRWLFVNC